MSGDVRDDVRDAAAREAAERVLRERARALAQPTAGAHAPTGAAARTATLVEFSLARERYLVEAAVVLAGFRLVDLTPLPGATPPVVGLTAWRGLVLTLVDLRGAAGGSAAGLDDLARVLVLGRDGAPVCGLLADVVHGAVTLPADAVLPPPATRAALPGLVRGVTADARVVLDGARLLDLLTGYDAAPVPARADTPALDPPAADPSHTAA